MPTTNDILGLILGGGRGSRLYPLTRERAKPAVPIAGKYRLIDIPISNCINSGITRIAILTQFNSVSLHRHIVRTYIFDAFHHGWVQILAAEQTQHSETWYQGTADAVRKQIPEIQSAGADYTLILSSDHLYRMDFANLAEFHWDLDADITIAVQPVHRDAAQRLGLLKRTADGRIVDFAEKPTDSATLANFICSDDPEKPYLGSMGIYLFKTSVLIHLLQTTTDDDFGGEVIPKAIRTHKVYGFYFDGYWEDIGTIRSYFEMNLKLARPDSPFNFSDSSRPIYSRPRFLPGSLIDGAKMHHVLLADGCRIGQADIEDAVIGLRSQIADGVVLRHSILIGADYYDPGTRQEAAGLPLGLGPGCQIEGAIIDKNTRLGAGVVIKPFPRGTEEDHRDWVVRDGIVVIPKNTILMANTRIVPGK